MDGKACGMGEGWVRLAIVDVDSSELRRLMNSRMVELVEAVASVGSPAGAEEFLMRVAPRMLMACRAVC